MIITIRNMMLLLFILGASAVVYSQSQAGCQVFAKSGLHLLDTARFTHDGKYNADKLTAGQAFEVYKPFYKDRSYRLAVIAADQLEGVTFEVLTIHQEVIFQSPAGRKSFTWDYVATKTQNLLIRVKADGTLVETKPDEKKIQGYCVALVIGLQKN